MISNEPLLRPSTLQPSRLATPPAQPPAADAQAPNSTPEVSQPAAPLTDRSDLKLPAGQAKPWIDLFDEPVLMPGGFEAQSETPAEIKEKPAEVNQPEPAETAPAEAPTEAPQAPSLKEIRQGALLSAPATGADVRQIKQMLNNLGYPVSMTQKADSYGDMTAGLIEQFQKDFGVYKPGDKAAHPGQVDLVTLKVMEQANGSLNLRKTMVENALKLHPNENSNSSCCTGVADTLDYTHRKTGYKAIKSGDAYEAAAKLAAQPSHFREIYPQNLNRLPPGAIIVWDRSPYPSERHRGHGWKSGHISIAAGRELDNNPKLPGHLVGKPIEISDFTGKQFNPYYVDGSTYRVFLPIVPPPKPGTALKAGK